MLKERIKLTDNGFRIVRDDTKPGRQAYFTKFSLRDGEIDKVVGNALSYWDAMNPVGEKVQDRTFVCVWENEDGQTVEEHLFYINRMGKKPRLRWHMERAPRYGERAYKITLEWMDNVYDSIHKNHICLKNRQNGRTYAFLKEYIEPVNLNDRIKKDEYIIDVPYDVEVADLMIEGDELLLQKYLLIR